MDLFEFFSDAQDEADQERQAAEAKRQAVADRKRERAERLEARDAELRRRAEERGRDWDAERHVPRICQAVVSKWGLPAGYDFADFTQDVSLRLWMNPWDPERAGGRSWTSWVYLLSVSVWKNAVAKCSRRRELAPMTSYENLQELGML